MTMRRAVLAALVVGCGSSASSPDGAMVDAGGTGGGSVDAAVEQVSDATGGVGGAAGMGGGAAGAEGGTSGTDGAAAACYGPCLEPLLDQCPRLGQSCTTAMSGGDTVNCYANGVKDLFTADGKMGSRRKANGELCLTVKIAVGQTDYSDGQGHPVGRLQETASSTQFLLTCTATGNITKVDLQASECFAYKSQPAMPCTPGACTW